MSVEPAAELRCSFCDKSQRHVRKLVAGPNVTICDECVDICLDILNEERSDAPAAARRGTTEPYLLASACALCRMATPVEHLLEIDGRGALCPGCIGAIEAALAAGREES